MKLRSIFVAACLAWPGASFAQTVPAVTSRPVLWSVHFDAERLRAGAGQALFASLDPMLTALSGQSASVPGGKLESVAVSGYSPQHGSGDPFPFLADLRFSAEDGGIARRFEAIAKKRDVPIEEIAGVPMIHFQHQGKEVWIAKVSDGQVLVGTSRAILAAALAPDGSSLAAATLSRPTEILGGKVEIEPLLGANPTLRASQLLKLLPHVEFHLLSEGGQMDLDASAQLEGERSARRAARMIDGMMAALAAHDPSGVPWDERLVLKQDGERLAMQLHLEPQEAKKLFDSLAREIESKGTVSTRDE